MLMTQNTVENPQTKSQIFQESDRLTITVRGLDFEGVLTDSDGIFFIAMMAPDTEMVLGTTAQGITFTQALNAIFDEMDGSETSEYRRSRWIDRLQQRVILSQEYREAFCQRVTEMFPSINRTGMISHNTEINESGRRSPKWSVRLEVTEILSDIIMPCLDHFMNPEYRETVNKRNELANERISKLNQSIAAKRSDIESQPAEVKGSTTVDVQAEDVWAEEAKSDPNRLPMASGATLDELIEAAGGRDRLETMLKDPSIKVST